MLTEEQFVAGVWERYDRYMIENRKDSFFKKHWYKQLDIMRKIRAIVNTSVGLVFLTGVVYAGFNGINSIIEDKLKDKIVEEKSISKSNIHTRDAEKFMDYNDKENLYYKILNSYDLYIEANNYFDDLIEMKEEDFENDIMIVINPIMENMTGKSYSYKIDDIVVNDNECKIIVNVGNKYNIENLYDNVKNDNDLKIIQKQLNEYIVLKLSRELYKENIIIENKANSANTQDYILLEEIGLDYSKEQAIKDGCFVFEGSGMDYNSKIVSKDLEMLERFVKNSNEKEKSFIRICCYSNEYEFVIYDIDYKDEEYLINWSVKSLISGNEKNSSIVLDKARTVEFEKDGIKYIDNQFYSSMHFIEEVNDGAIPFHFIYRK